MRSGCVLSNKVLPFLREHDWNPQRLETPSSSARLHNLSVCVCSGQEEDGRRVLVLSYPQYCRYRSVLARLREQPSSLIIDHTVLALGGIAASGGNMRILYCRDTFEHPTLLQNESICDEFGECGLSCFCPVHVAAFLPSRDLNTRVTSATFARFSSEAVNEGLFLTACSGPLSLENGECLYFFVRVLDVNSRS